MNTVQTPVQVIPQKKTALTLAVFPITSERPVPFRPQETVPAASGSSGKTSKCDKNSRPRRSRRRSPGRLRPDHFRKSIISPGKSNFHCRAGSPDPADNSHFQKKSRLSAAIRKETILSFRGSLRLSHYRAPAAARHRFHTESPPRPSQLLHQTKHQAERNTERSPHQEPPHTLRPVIPRLHSESPQKKSTCQVDISSPNLSRTAAFDRWILLHAH